MFSVPATFSTGLMGAPHRAFALRSRRRSRSLLAALKEELRFASGAMCFRFCVYSSSNLFPSGAGAWGTASRCSLNNGSFSITTISY